MDDQKKREPIAAEAIEKGLNLDLNPSHGVKLHAAPKNVKRPTEARDVWLLELNNEHGRVFAIRYDGEVLIEQPNELDKIFIAFLLTIRSALKGAFAVQDNPDLLLKVDIEGGGGGGDGP